MCEGKKHSDYSLIPSDLVNSVNDHIPILVKAPTGNTTQSKKDILHNQRNEICIALFHNLE